MSEKSHSLLPPDRIEKLSLQEALAVFIRIAALSDRDLAGVTSAKALSGMGKFTAALVEVFPAIAVMQRSENTWHDFVIEIFKRSEKGEILSLKHHTPILQHETEQEGIRHIARITYTNSMPLVFPSQDELTRMLIRQTPEDFSLDSYVKGKTAFWCSYVFRYDCNTLFLRLGNVPVAGYNLTENRLTVPEEKEEAFRYMATGLRTVARVGLSMYKNAMAALAGEIPPTLPTVNN